MSVTGRTGYGLRAAVELAGAGGSARTVAQLAAAQNIPPRFLENILLILRHARLWLGVSANVRSVLEGITLADVASGELPPEVQLLLVEPPSYQPPPPAEPVLDVLAGITNQVPPKLLTPCPEAE